MRDPAQLGGQVPVLAGITVLAWAALLYLGQTSGGAQANCHSAAALVFWGSPSADSFRTGFAAIAGWMLMTVAMMLPTLCPFAHSIRRTPRECDNQANLLTPLVAGYLMTWLTLGLLLMGLGYLAGRSMGPAPAWLTHNQLVAALLAAAGLFQFLPGKQRCLEKCRSHFEPAALQWNRHRPVRDSFRLGIRHGVTCAGSCGALMLPMLAVESAHLLWMGLLTLAMIAEKDSPWGPRLVKPLGVLLIIAAVSVFIFSRQSAA